MVAVVVDDVGGTAADVGVDGCDVTGAVTGAVVGVSVVDGAAGAGASAVRTPLMNGAAAVGSDAKPAETVAATAARWLLPSKESAAATPETQMIAASAAVIRMNRPCAIGLPRAASHY